MTKFISFIYMGMIVMEFARQAEKGTLLLLKWNDLLKKVGVFFLFTVIYEKRKV
jgi:hypothetical protein